MTAFVPNSHLYGCTRSTCTGCVADPCADLRAELAAAKAAYVPKSIALTPEAREVRLRPWRAPDDTSDLSTDPAHVGRVFCFRGDDMSNDAKTQQLARLLTEFGSAIRGDWGSIDGRFIQGAMDNFAGWAKAPESMPDIETCRDWMGVCPEGRGHWTDWCVGDCIEEETT